MKDKKYKNYWLTFVEIRAKEGFKFVDLIDFEDSTKEDIYIGAWANVLIKAENVNEALKIVPMGLDELNFEIVFIDKIENIGSLIEYNEITDKVRAEVEWLAESGFVFKISDKLFPYGNASR